MSKVNFGENWAILRGAKVGNNQSVDFAGSRKTPVAGMGTATGGAQGRGARKGAKGGSTRGAQVAAQGQKSSTGKLEGRNCIIKDGPHKGAVDPDCDEYQAGLAGREKLKEGSDPATIRQNVKDLMGGAKGYASPYLEKGKHGHTYSKNQALAIAYKKAGLSGSGGGSGGGGEKTAKQKFLDKNLPSTYNVGFDNRKKALEAVHGAYDKQAKSMKDASGIISRVMSSNPGMSPEGILGSIRESGMASDLNDDQLNQLIKQASGGGAPGEEGGGATAEKVTPMGFDQAGDALSVTDKSGNELDLTDIADKLIEQLKIPADQGDNYSPTPEQYKQLIEGIKQQALQAGVDPKEVDDNILKSAIAGYYSGMVPTAAPAQAQAPRGGAAPTSHEQEMMKNIQSLPKPYGALGTPKAEEKYARGRMRALEELHNRFPKEDHVGQGYDKNRHMETARRAEEADKKKAARAAAKGAQPGGEQAPPPPAQPAQPPAQKPAPAQPTPAPGGGQAPPPPAQDQPAPAAAQPAQPPAPAAQPPAAKPPAPAAQQPAPAAKGGSKQSPVANKPPVSDEDHNKMGTMLSDLVGKAKGNKVASGLAKQLGINLEDLHSFLQEATRRSSTAPPAAAPKETKKPAANTTKTKAKPKTESENKPETKTEPESKTELPEKAPKPRGGRSARSAVTTGADTDKPKVPLRERMAAGAKRNGIRNASEHSPTPPHGWQFCEPSKSTPLIAEGQDANRNLVKVPEGWSPTVS